MGQQWPSWRLRGRRPTGLVTRALASGWAGHPRRQRPSVTTSASTSSVPSVPGLPIRWLAFISTASIDRIEDDKGLSPEVVLRCHGQLRAMFSRAVRKKLIGANPAVAADPPRVKSRQLQVPEMAHVRAIQDVAPPQFGTFIQLAATVGARRGTLVGVRWGDVDLDRGTITFSRAIAESVYGPVEKGTKADRPYTVVLGPATGAILAEHRRRAAEAALAVGASFGPQSFVFSDDGGQSPWSLSWPSHCWQRYSAKARVPHLRLHDLRHVAASQMLMAGVPVSVVAERLGCTEADVLRTYRHFIPGSDQQAAELMDRLLSTVSCVQQPSPSG